MAGMAIVFIATMVFVASPSSTSSKALAPPADSRVWTRTVLATLAPLHATATLLPDGRVLVCGGDGGAIAIGAQLFDPVSNTWRLTGFLNGERARHAAVLLDDGRVLVAGGYKNHGLRNDTEIWSPATGEWSPGPTLSIPRSHVEMVRLTDGSFLVATGTTSPPEEANTCEILDPSATGFRSTGSLRFDRFNASLTLLADGRVLVVGGQAEGGYHQSCEVYDPVTEAWTFGPIAQDVHAQHAAVRLPDGRVLVTGSSSVPFFSKEVEVFDPQATGSVAVASMNVKRAGLDLTVLPDGLVLASGGGLGIEDGPTTELYDPLADTWTRAATMIQARADHHAVLLPDGRVVVAGEVSSGTAARYGEVFGPPGPQITSIRVRRNAAGVIVLTMKGTAIREGARVFVDGVAFVAGAKLSANRAKLTQKGLLVDGRTISAAFPTGQLVVVTVTNADGGFAAVEYAKP